MAENSPSKKAHQEVYDKKEIVKGGGGTYRAILGGGGETYHKAPPPKPVLEASENGIRLVCACFLQRNNLGRGFMVCFPLPWVFLSPPLFFSDPQKGPENCAARNCRKVSENIFDDFLAWPLCRKLSGMFVV